MDNWRFGIAEIPNCIPEELLREVTALKEPEHMNFLKDIVNRLEHLLDSLQVIE